MRKDRKYIRLAAAAAGMALLCGLCACQALGEAESSSQAVEEDLSLFPEGALIGGRSVAGQDVDEALKTAREAMEEDLEELEITVKFRDDTIVLAGADFVAQDMLEETVPGFLEDRQGKDHPLHYVVDLSETGEQKVLDAAKSCATQAQNATVTGRDENGFAFSEEQKGSQVDLAKTLESVRQLLSEKRGGDIQAAFVETEPTLTKAYLQEHFVKLSSYTTVSTNTANGTSNMGLALSKVNGTILQPGQEFSYNTCLGDSTDPNAGWLPAGGISSGVIVQMYGGGICQGSSTLYIAALYAGMEITERWEHSIPSSYCPIGLDATVDYGNLDFRFKNPLDTPIYISAWLDGVNLYVEFYGCFPQEWDSVAVTSEQTGSWGPLDSVSFREDSSLAAGQYVRRSSGNTGYSARAYRAYYKGDTLVKSEELASSEYPATGVVYAVGPGTDTDKVDTSKESGSTSASATPKPADPTPAPAQPDPQPAEPTPAPQEPTPAPEEPTPAPEEPTPAPVTEPTPAPVATPAPQEPTPEAPPETEPPAEEPLPPAEA